MKHEIQIRYDWDPFKRKKLFEASFTFSSDKETFPKYKSFEDEWEFLDWCQKFHVKFIGKHTFAHAFAKSREELFK